MTKNHKHKYNNLYYGYLCELKHEEYMANVYVVGETLVLKKDNGEFVDLSTHKTLKVISTDEKGHISEKEEGMYLAALIPFDEYLKDTITKTLIPYEEYLKGEAEVEVKLKRKKK